MADDFTLLQPRIEFIGDLTKFQSSLDEVKAKIKAFQRDNKLTINMSIGSSAGLEQAKSSTEKIKRSFDDATRAAGKLEKSNPGKPLDNAEKSAKRVSIAIGLLDGLRKGNTKDLDKLSHVASEYKKNIGASAASWKEQTSVVNKLQVELKNLKNIGPNEADAASKFNKDIKEAKDLRAEVNQIEEILKKNGIEKYSEVLTKGFKKASIAAVKFNKSLPFGNKAEIGSNRLPGFRDIKKQGLGKNQRVFLTPEDAKKAVGRFFVKYNEEIERNLRSTSKKDFNKGKQLAAHPDARFLADQQKRANADKQKAIKAQEKLQKSQQAANERQAKLERSSRAKEKKAKEFSLDKKRESALHSMAKALQQIEILQTKGQVSSRNLASTYIRIRDNIKAAKISAQELINTGNFSRAGQGSAIFGMASEAEKGIRSLKAAATQFDKLRSAEKRAIAFERTMRSLAATMTRFGGKAAKPVSDLSRFQAELSRLGRDIKKSHPHFLKTYKVISRFALAAYKISIAFKVLRRAIHFVIKSLRLLAKLAGIVVKSFLGIVGAALDIASALGGVVFGTFRKSVKGLLFPIFNLAEGFKQLARYAPLISAIGTIQFGRGIVNTFKDFDDEITRVNANLMNFARGAGSSFNAVRQRILDISDATVFTATETARATDILIRAGLNAQQAFTALTPTLNLAITGNTSIDKAADIVISAVNTFGLGVDKLEDLTDAIRSASVQAQVEVGDLAVTLQNAGFVFREAGISIEELLAITTQLGTQGVSGERAGTALRRGATEIIAATKKQLQQVNFLIKKGSGDANKNLSDFLDGTGAKFRPGGFLDLLDTFEKAKISLGDLQDLLGARGQFFAGIFGAGGVASIRRKLRIIQFDQQFNLAAKQSDILRKSMGNVLKVLKSIGENIQVNLVVPIEEKLMTAIDSIREGLLRVKGVIIGSDFSMFANTIVDTFGSIATKAASIANKIGKWIAYANLFAVSVGSGLLDKALVPLERIVDRISQKLGKAFGFSNDKITWEGVLAKSTEALKQIGPFVDRISEAFSRVSKAVAEFRSAIEGGDGWKAFATDLAGFLFKTLVSVFRSLAQIFGIELASTLDRVVFARLEAPLKSMLDAAIPTRTSALRQISEEGRIRTSLSVAASAAGGESSAVDRLIGSSVQIGVAKALLGLADKVKANDNVYAAQMERVLEDFKNKFDGDSRQGQLEEVKTLNEAFKDLAKSVGQNIDVFNGAVLGAQSARLSPAGAGVTVLNKLSDQIKRAIPEPVIQVWDAFAKSLRRTTNDFKNLDAKNFVAAALHTKDLVLEGLTGKTRLAERSEIETAEKLSPSLVGVADFFDRIQGSDIQVRQLEKAAETVTLLHSIEAALRSVVGQGNIETMQTIKNAVVEMADGHAGGME